jgi:hypothetical protein
MNPGQFQGIFTLAHPLLWNGCALPATPDQAPMHRILQEIMQTQIKRTAFRPAAASLTLALALALARIGSAEAQSYTLVDLTPNAGNGVATGISAGVAAGYSATAIFSSLTHALLWDGTGATDLHPTAFDLPASGTPGRSSVLDINGNLQVGWAAGSSTGNRTIPMAWRGSADTATTLAIPFTNYGGQATATDGTQIAGYAIPSNSDGTAQGPARGIVWDAASGAPVDLGDGGNGAMVYGVGGGQQVGYVIKKQASAALWRGTEKSLVVLHPTGAITSVANDTDGTRQVGYAGYDVRVRQEAAKGNKTARFNYAMVWNGTAASATSIHPYPVNSLPGINLSQSYALGVNGSWIVGYAGDQTKFGSPAYSHAIVWDAEYQSTDLNAYLPAGFVGAQATSVDANGNVSGFMAKSDGTRHAVVWLLNPAQ